jgi:hypothetical protein
MVAKQIQASALASVLAALVLAGPADAAQQDLRSPNVRDAAAAQAQKRGHVITRGLRAPDWLSPHAREPAPLIAPGTGAPAAAPTVVEITPADGFDWTSAGIGAGGGIALVVIALGGVAAVTSRSWPARR